MQDINELVDHCLSRYESGESISQIAEFLEVDVSDVHLLMTKDPYRYDYAEFAKTRRQSAQLQKIEQAAARTALHYIETLEVSFQSPDVPKENICSIVDDVRNITGLLKQFRDSFDSRHGQDKDKNDRPFQVLIKKTYAAPDGSDEPRTETIEHVIDR